MLLSLAFIIIENRDAIVYLYNVIETLRELLSHAMTCGLFSFAQFKSALSFYLSLTRSLYEMD